MNVLASIFESMERLKYLTHMLLGYADTDLPKKSRVYCKPLDLECYFTEHVGEAAGMLRLAVKE
jgi:hypothetical protein